jgi:hypothetical protein
MLKNRPKSNERESMCYSGGFDMSDTLVRPPFNSDIFSARELSMAPMSRAKNRNWNVVKTPTTTLAGRGSSIAKKVVR